MKQHNNASSMNRRTFVQAVTGTAVVIGLQPHAVLAEDGNSAEVNLAKIAVATSSGLASEGRVSALNDGFAPASSADREHGLHIVRGGYGPASDGGAWVQYTWSEPVATDRVDVYWAIDAPRPNALPGSRGNGMQGPASYRILYWDGTNFVPVKNASGLGVVGNTFNRSTFEAVRTDKIRLEVTPEGRGGAGILEWRVLNAGPVPAMAPLVEAGIDRSVVLGGKTYLAGKSVFLQDLAGNNTRWTKASGPGAVEFADATAPVTTATFSAPGDYVLRLSGSGQQREAHAELHVHAEARPPKNRLDVVYTTPYTIDSAFWQPRAKALIVNWIPHCIAYCERTDIPAGRGDGGLDNFIEAAKALRGEPHGKHKGYVFSNAWVHQTVESMCIALMYDAQGDPEILAAQQHMRDALERWIPIVLGAQMPDGYLQTAYVLADRKYWPERWSPDHRGNHEGYVSGYFIESAINHYMLTQGKDLRLYNAAKKLADCWVANIGPGKKEWFDGHQEMEQALVRFGRFVNDQEGNHRGDAYITLAKFLLDSRRGGQEYDQSHLPPGQQYEAVGHAVRAVYFYSGMADVAAETQDHDYQSAVLSLWDNMVNRKYYVTGGIGSGETSEGFGPNYSLRNNAYCESCSSCGLIFFQYKLNLAYHDAKYADLYEETMYNALLGGMALDGKSYCYTNPLVNTERALWHTCPCCVGNISRTLLMMPTWSYVRGEDGIYVNMFVGSRMRVGKVAGTDLEIVQKTDYPWKGAVAITVNPAEAKSVSVYVRVPNRRTSSLYTEMPKVQGMQAFKVNGKAVTPKIEKGYAVVSRVWKKGDTIEFQLPMEPQRVVADDRIKADLGDAAFKYGPLVYNVEAADNENIGRGISDAPLKTEWKPELLGGVMTINGTWKDGSPMTAIPNYTRMNRQGPPHEYPGEGNVNYAPGTTANGASTTAAGANGNAAPMRRRPNPVSKVWI